MFCVKRHMSDLPKLIGRTCLDAFQRLLDECLRFKASELYLAKVQFSACQDGGLAKEAYDQFVEHLKPNYASPQEYFVERSFIMLVASFELFLQELLQVIVTAYPKKVGQIEFKLSEIIDAGSPDELVRQAIDTTLNQLMYKKPNEYLTAVANLLSIDADALRGEWLIFAEAKARRDLAVHNGCKCNAIYLRKIKEAGLVSQYKLGERVFPPAPGYLDQVCKTLSNLANVLMDTVIAKHKAILNRSAK